MTRRYRDEFNSKTQKALALRANYRCSYARCGVPTSGPSDESPHAHVSIGVAAHIHAAAPGGPRYAPEMSPEARSDIANGIWLCQMHSRLIDSDPTRFTPALLVQMRTDHEARVREEMERRSPSQHNSNFVAIGPDIVFVGELVRVEGELWDFRIDHFLVGDLGTLIAFVERFERIASADRFVLVNALGDGRQLASAPIWRKGDASDLLSLKLHPSAPRINAHELPADIAVNEANDIFLEYNDLATVSGLAALPQRIKTCLSTLRGEVPHQPTFGSRITEYFDLFRNSPWLPHLVKLEVIRMASLPISDTTAMSTHTALRSVSRVLSVEQLPSENLRGWIPFHLYLDVKGVGPWRCDLSILVPTDKASLEIDIYQKANS